MFPFKGRGEKSQIQTAEPAFSLGEVDKHPSKNNFSSHPSTNAREKTGQPLKKGPPTTTQRPGEKKLPHLHLCLRMAPTGRVLMDLWDPLVMGGEL